MPYFIAFDLEGPLTPLDAAFQLFVAAPNGPSLFRTISRYDDILVLEGREGYEPGDTLSLILPFLLHHNVGEKDIESLGKGAPLVPGASDTVQELSKQGWEIFCISTSYQQFASAIASRVGISFDRLASTPLPLGDFYTHFGDEDRITVSEIETILGSYADTELDIEATSILDSIFWDRLPKTGVGRMMAKVVPVGGTRKVKRLAEFLERCGLTLKDAVVVGDSITDRNMLSAVDKAGGLAVAFNANSYALSVATVGLASTNLMDILPLTRAWGDEGRSGTESFVREAETKGGEADREHFFWLSGREDLSVPIETHSRIRYVVRAEAAALG